MSENAPTRSLDDIDLAALRVSSRVFAVYAPARVLHTERDPSKLLSMLCVLKICERETLNDSESCSWQT